MRFASKSSARLLPLLALIAGSVEVAIAQETHDHLVTQCVDIPPGEQRPEFGCWVVATAHDLTFAESSIYWHLRKFPGRQAAEAAKTRAGVVGVVEEQVWLSDFGPWDMKLEGGEKVAVIGPLELPKAKPYDAVFMSRQGLGGERERFEVSRSSNDGQRIGSALTRKALDLA